MSKNEEHIKSFLFILCFFTFCFLQGMKAQPADEIAKARRVIDERGEVIIRFRQPQTLSIDELTRNLSIDNKKGDTLTAYASEKQFTWFLGQQIPFKVIGPRNTFNTSAQSKKSTSQGWDSYPAYPEYLQMMESFATGHTDLCILKEFGTSVNGRKLLAVKISDNPAEDEPEPVFLYTSSIHGDEGTGFVLLLRLIDSLLTAYSLNPAIKQLVDDTEIWVNPLSNPDGFFFSSDTFPFGSRRFNLNNIDLNRNFPDPVTGDHPDGEPWQAENTAMMNFMKQQGIVLSANLHDGAELVNYPWDCRFARHADDNWYAFISRQFADTVQHYGPAGFFKDEKNGITNGYDWYSIYGGRQDYVNHFLHGREITLELSHIKSVDPSALPSYWDTYKKSLIDYIRHIHAGVHGFVIDSENGRPLEAMVEIPGHDKDSSQVSSDPETGEFYRLLRPGDYSLRAASPGYQSRQVDISIAAGETREIILSLLPVDLEFTCFPVPFTHTLNLLLPDDALYNLEIALYDASGRVMIRKILPAVRKSAQIDGLGSLPRGLYLVRLTADSFTREYKVAK